MSTTAEPKESTILQAPTDLPVLSQSVSQTSQLQQQQQQQNVHMGEEQLKSDLEKDDDSIIDGLGNDEDVVEYPEGGLKAWSVVFGSFLCMVASFGAMNTLGTLHAHLSKNQLINHSSGEIGWIFGVYSFLSFFGGIIIGPVFDTFGPAWLLRTGAVFLVAGLMLFSISTLYWHFMLTFGVLAGIGTCLIFTPAVASIGHWFLVKRAYATGVATTGGSIGGIIFPLIIQKATPQIGFAWAVRTVGFVQIFLLLCGMTLVRARPEVIHGRQTPANEAQTSSNIPGLALWRALSSIRIDLKAFLDPRFTLTTISVFFIEWAVFVPLTYITSHALNLGLPLDLSYQLLAILNVGSVFGRWLPGFVADKMGRFNTMLITVCFCMITVLAFWIPSEYVSTLEGRKAILVVFALLYGFGSGSGISLTPVCVGQICTTKEYGTKFGTCYFFVSFGTLTGIPIAGQIVSAGGGSYIGLICFTAASYVAAFIFFFAARWIGLGMQKKPRGLMSIY
ncbi:major facilitator superfamily domain-containing protein [Pyronema omphalodes]|nr:major facilitator superfamily domain-containing protein [Pyronema omphalodes]